MADAVISRGGFPEKSTLLSSLRKPVLRVGTVKSECFGSTSSIGVAKGVRVRLEYLSGRKFDDVVGVEGIEHEETVESLDFSGDARPALSPLYVPFALLG